MNILLTLAAVMSTVVLTYAFNKAYLNKISNRYFVKLSVYINSTSSAETTPIFIGGPTYARVPVTVFYGTFTSPLSGETATVKSSKRIEEGPMTVYLYKNEFTDTDPRTEDPFVTYPLAFIAAAVVSSLAALLLAYL